MERPQSELGSIAKDVLEDLERVRPGWDPSLSKEQLEPLIKNRVTLRCAEMLQERTVDDFEENSQTVALYLREIESVLIPRYTLLAQKQNQAEISSSKPFYGGDLYNRVLYSTLFFLVGVFVVWAPFIPIWDKWIPFVLAALAPIASPLLPNAHRFISSKKHQISLLSLQYDMDKAGLALPTTPQKQLQATIPT